MAAFSVIDLIAVANVETLLGAILPDRVLNKPRERPWKPPVELAGIDLLGDGLDDLGAAARPVAGEAVGVVGSEPAQNAGPVQEIVHERIDGDHAAADLAPAAHRQAGKDPHQRGGAAAIATRAITRAMNNENDKVPSHHSCQMP